METTTASSGFLWDEVMKCAVCRYLRSTSMDSKGCWFKQPYLEDGLPGLGYVVNNHGDRTFPKDRVVGPLANGRNLWLINGGY